MVESEKLVFEKYYLLVPKSDLNLCLYYDNSDEGVILKDRTDPPDRNAVWGYEDLGNKEYKLGHVVSKLYLNGGRDDKPACVSKGKPTLNQKFKWEGDLVKQEGTFGSEHVSNMHLTHKLEWNRWCSALWGNNDNLRWKWIEINKEELKKAEVNAPIKGMKWSLHRQSFNIELV